MSAFVGIVLTVAVGWVVLLAAFLWLWCVLHPTRGRHTAAGRVRAAQREAMYERVVELPDAVRDEEFFTIADELPDVAANLALLISGIDIEEEIQ